MKYLTEKRLVDVLRRALMFAIISAGIYLFYPIEAAQMKSASGVTAPGLTIGGAAFPNGENLAGATVFLRSAGRVLATTTDESGAYSFANVAAGGDYELSIYKEGFVFEQPSRRIQNLQSSAVVNLGPGTPLCAPAPMTPNIWYRAENNGNDSSGRLNDGNFTGAAVYDAGKVGRSFIFNGGNRLQSTTYDLPLGTQPRTMMMWVYIHSLPYIENFFAGYGAFGTNNGVFMMGAFQDGRLYYSQWGQAVVSTQTLQPGTWNHVAVNVTATGAQLFINGASAGFGLLNTNTLPGVLSVGQAPAGFETTRKFDGRIDELQIYDRIVTPDELLKIYNAGGTGVCTAAIPTGIGTLDATFGSGGRIYETVSTFSDLAGAVAVQPDGKILVAGNSYSGASYDFMLLRYNPDGTLDNSFGTGGKVFTDFDVNYDYAGAIAIQADGRIILAGTSTKTSQNITQFALTRYNPDGTLDASFGSGGKVLTHSTAANEVISAVLIQSNGRIVVAGGVRDGSSWKFLLARYNTSGAPDQFFGINGTVLTPVGDAAGGYALSAALQTDGKIVAAGYAINSATRDDIAVVRYQTDGSLDSTFGAGGIVMTDFGANGYDAAYAVKIQTDGKIVVGGRSGDGNQRDFALARYNASGALDPTFGSGGKVLTDVGANSSDQINSIALRPDGKIIAAGDTNFGANPNNALVAYNADGSLFTNFGTEGKVVTAFGTLNDYATAMAIQPDGKIVTAGYNTYLPSNVHTTLARYNGNGLNVSPATNLRLDFSTSIKPGNTVADALTPAQIPALPPGVTLYPFAPVYDVRTSALYANVAVTENVPNVQSAQACSSLRLYHFTNGAWTSSGNSAPQFNAGTLVCTLSQTVTSLSPFAVGQGAAPQTGAATPFDFDGDRKTDVSIFRPSSGEWWYSRSSDGGSRAAQFGAATDKLTPGDFTGDGKADLAFWRPSSGEWYVLRSENSSFFSFPFGAAGDTPLVGDFDGDGKADAAVFRPATGTWYILNSGGGGTSIVNFGISSDKPVAADYDGDGKTDLAIFRPSDGSWWYLQSSNAQFKVYRFGASSDKPVPGDYTGDGKADIAVFRPATGEWFVQRSEDNSFFSFPFGAAGDVPVPGDYDGDGKSDAGVFRPSNATWYLNRSAAGVAIQAFGLSTDNPVPNAFVQ